MLGNITSRNSFGTHYLIKGAGAKLIQTWEDVIAEFQPELAARLLPPELKQKKEVGDGAPRTAELSEAERAVLTILRSDAPVHIDALAETSGLTVQELAGVLLTLEMRELIRQLPGKSFVKKL